MAKILPEAITIILDVGSTGASSSSYFEKAKLCATMIIERKIFSESKDELSLIFLGSEKTKNQLANDESYRNIENAHDFQLANWNMIRSIAKYKEPTKIKGDYVDGLIIALDSLREHLQTKDFSSNKIVLLADVSLPVNDDSIDQLINGIRILETQVVAIVNTEDQSIKEESNVISKITAETSGIQCSFEDALPQLVYFERSKVNPAAWKSVLDLGSDFKISVVGYKKIAPVKKPTFKNVTIPSASITKTAFLNAGASNDGDGFKLTPEVKAVDRDVVFTTVGENPAPVDDTQIIEGFMFGTTIVPMSKGEADHFIYKSGERCLSVLGFTPVANISRYYQIGDGCYYFFPENDADSIKAFSALIHAMDETGCAAIVRKVYRLNSNPTVGMLLPKIKEKYQCLVYIELPYADMIQSHVFPPLTKEKSSLSKEELDAVDSLIDSMDLMTADSNGEEAFRPKKSLDPSLQNFYHVIAKKVLNDESKIKNIDATVSALLSPPEELAKQSEAAVENIKKKFPLIEIVRKEGERRAAADIFKTDDKPSTSNSGVDIKTESDAGDKNSVKTCSIGTIRPQEDFLSALEDGIPLDKACEKMQCVITELVKNAFDEEYFSKPLKALQVMRSKCVERNPNIFNKWLVELKKDLPETKHGFFNLLKKDQQGLISREESVLSSVSVNEAQDFWKVDEGEEEDKMEEEVNEDLDDLINQM